MPVAIQKLDEASTRYPLVRSASSLSEARAAGLQTAYLCHDPKDLILAEGLQVLFKDRGWNVYLDFDETSISEKTSPEQLAQTHARIQSCDWFIFLATENSFNLRWCFLELGYAEGVKPHDALLVIPTKGEKDLWYGGELLPLYRHIDVTSSQQFGAFRPGEDRGVRVADLSIVK